MVIWRYHSDGNSIEIMRNFERLARFALVSAFTLGLDLVVFSGLSTITTPIVANLVSSTFAGLSVYLLASLFVFFQDLAIQKGFSVVAWYMIATALWSVVIQVETVNLPVTPFEAKLLTVPCSFLLNFLVTRFVISNRS